MNQLFPLRDTPGLIAKIARGLEITPSAVSQWKRIPAESIAEIEKITGIPRHILRPDLWREPEIIARAPLNTKAAMSQREILALLLEVCAQSKGIRKLCSAMGVTREAQR